MPRELIVPHDPVVLTSPDVGWALAVHQAVLSLVELLDRGLGVRPWRVCRR